MFSWHQSVSQPVPVLLLLNSFLNQSHHDGVKYEYWSMSDCEPQTRVSCVFHLE